MKRKRIISMLLCLAMLLSAAGCKKQEQTGTGADEETAKVSADKMASSIKDKYAKSETKEYQEGVTDIERDQPLEVQWGVDIKNDRFDDYTQLVEVFQDAELTQSIGTHFEWDEASKVLSITPPKAPAGTISNAEQIIVLDDGKIAGIGTHRQLLESCEIYRQIALSQLSEEELQK